MISHPRNIEPVLALVDQVDPASVVDVGIGFGKWALLLREWALSKAAEAGDLTPVDDLLVFGVESAPYFAAMPWLDTLYDDVIWGDAAEAFELWRPDLVLLVDVVEHWPVPAGIEHVGGWLAEGVAVIVSTPIDPVMYEVDYYGDGCPRHCSRWSPDDAAGLAAATGSELIAASTDVSHIWLFRPQPKDS
jgi:hypothetical protein